MEYGSEYEDDQDPEGVIYAEKTQHRIREKGLVEDEILQPLIVKVREAAQIFMQHGKTRRLAEIDDIVGYSGILERLTADS